MSPLDLEGLEFKRFNEIPDFEEKLSIFLDSLTVETKTWRDFEEKNGKRYIPHPIDGYACLDGDKIVGLNYFILPKKYSLTYFIHKLFPPKKAELGGVIHRDYQGRGITSSVRILRFRIMLKQGYTHGWGVGDPSNIARIKSIQKVKGHKIVEKNGKNYDYWNLKKVIEYHEEKDINNKT